MSLPHRAQVPDKLAEKCDGSSRPGIHFDDNRVSQELALIAKVNESETNQDQLVFGWLIYVIDHKKLNGGLGGLQPKPHLLLNR